MCFWFLDAQQAAFRKISAEAVQVHDKAVFVSSRCETLWCKINAAYTEYSHNSYWLHNILCSALSETPVTYVTGKCPFSYVDKYLIRAKDRLLEADK